MYKQTIEYYFLKIPLMILLLIFSISCIYATSNASDKKLLKLAEKNYENKEVMISYLVRILQKIKNRDFRNMSAKGLEYSIYQSLAHKGLLRLNYQKYHSHFVRYSKHESPALRTLAILKFVAAKDRSKSSAFIDILENEPVADLQIEALDALKRMKISVPSTVIIKLHNNTLDRRLRHKLVAFIVNRKLTGACTYIYKKVRLHVKLDENSYVYFKAYVILRCKHARAILLQYLSTNSVNTNISAYDSDVLRMAESFHDHILNKALIIYFKKTKNMEALNLLIRMRYKPAFKLIKPTLAGSSQSQRSKIKLLMSLLILDDIRSINIILNYVQAQKNKKFRLQIISDIERTLRTDIKHRQYIISKLITTYAQENKDIRKQIADMIYSFKKYSGKKDLKSTILNEPNLKLQCTLLIPYLRLADKSDATLIKRFDDLKYGGVCQESAREFLAKLRKSAR